MLTTLPLEAFVCREVMTNYWFRDEPWDLNRHIIFSTALVLGAMILSLLTCDLGAVFELIGATSACALAYILPPLCYIKLSTRSWKTIPAVVCVIFGVVVMSISLVQAVVKLITRKSVAQLWQLFELIILQTIVLNSIAAEETAGLDAALSAGSGLLVSMRLAQARQVSTNLIENDAKLQDL